MKQPVTKIFPTGNASVQKINEVFQRQHAAFLDAPVPDYRERVAWMRAIESFTEKNARAIAQAISRDFGNRSLHETYSSDILMTVSAARHARKNLKRWMRPRKVPANAYSKPGVCRIYRQPLGVVGIISPWNFPYSFVMIPAISALAAGNRVMVKPSEFTPATTELMGNLVAEHFPEDRFALVPGGVEVGQAFSQLPFDHLLFTGSGVVGRQVAQAATKNLTPTTLELGGKCPAILDPAGDYRKAVGPILRGKLHNAGQACIAVDHIFAPADQLEPLVQALLEKAVKFYPTFRDNPDVTSIINERHFGRLMVLLEDAEQKGARVLRPDWNESVSPDPVTRRFPFTILLDVTPEMKVMQEEIFGPLLPILPYDDLGKVVGELAEKERPLALYWFGRNSGRQRYILENTWAGGMTVNDTLLHILQEHLPFGGVGASGQGAHFGQAGFNTFSHEKGVFFQTRLDLSWLINPPYTPFSERFLAFLRRMSG